MNNEIKAKVMAIFEAALEINKLGKFHVFVDLMAHVEGVGVRIIPADTDYSVPSYEPLSATAYYGAACHNYLPTKEREPAALKQLQSCLDLVISHAAQLERSA